ncbi:MAG TPA: two-component system response regulator [Firmicutes bacterium]|nr:two-component system response regulator [Bacillota bacterium]
MVIKVMVIEDDPMVRSINERFVSKMDCFKVVKSAGDMLDAKEYLTQHEVDLILLDVYLPTGSGLELLKWIREQNLRSEVILITAENKIDGIALGLRLGAIDYLIKPFTFSRLQEALNKYLIRHSKLNSLECLDQEFIDVYLLGAKKQSNEKKEEVNKQPLRSGLNQKTYQQILSYVKKSPQELTAEVIANQLGLARVTVRRYLDHMVNAEELELERLYGKVGRPIHVYKMNR